MKTHFTLPTLLVAVLGIGCGQVKFQTDNSAAKDQLTQQSLPIVQAVGPSCEIDDTDYELSAQVISFEILSTNNVAFGFDLASNFFHALDVGVKATSGQIYLTMDLIDTLQPKYALAEVTGAAKSQGTQFNFDINVLSFGTDFGTFSQTPVATLTNDGLTNGFNNVKQKLQSLNQAWKTRVTTVTDDHHVIIPAGSLAGIKAGDTFNLYNVNNVWKGAPCISQLLISQKTTDTPIAIGKATQVNVNASVLVLSNVAVDTPPLPGAMVEINNLVSAGSAKRTALNQSIRIGSMLGGKIVIGANTTDLSSYLSNQIRPIVENGGFYIKRP